MKKKVFMVLVLAVASAGILKLQLEKSCEAMRNIDSQEVASKNFSKNFRGNGLFEGKTTEVFGKIPKTAPFGEFSIASLSSISVVAALATISDASKYRFKNTLQNTIFIN